MSSTNDSSLLPNFRVYVIESSEALDELRRKLSNAGEIIAVSVMRRWDAEKRALLETKNKNRVMCREEVMTKFISLHPEYREYVEDYKWATFPYPKEEKGETTDLHITCIPNDYTQQQAEEIIMSCLDNIGLPHDKYRMKFSLKSRELGTINGFCHLIFDRSVPRDTIYIAKLLLHHFPLKAKTSSQISNIVAIWYIEGKKARSQRTLPVGADIHHPYLEVKHSTPIPSNILNSRVLAVSSSSSTIPSSMTSMTSMSQSQSQLSPSIMTSSSMVSSSMMPSIATSISSSSK